MSMTERISKLVREWRKSADLAEQHIGDSGIEIENETHMRDMRMCADQLEAEDSVEVPQPIGQPEKLCSCGQWPHKDFCMSAPATPPTPQPALCCPLCGASSPGVFWGRCAQYRDAGEPAHVFHWPSTSEALRAKMSAAPPDLDSLLQPLKDACDRAWGNETPAQIVIIAANAIYWRDEELKKLRAGVPVEPCQHFVRTVECNGKWVTECEKCGVQFPALRTFPIPVEPQPFTPTKGKLIEDYAIWCAAEQPNFQKKMGWWYDRTMELVELAGVEQPTPKEAK